MKHPIKMKLRWIGILGLAWSFVAFAQGTVNFNNSPGALGGDGAPFL